MNYTNDNDRLLALLADDVQRAKHAAEYAQRTARWAHNAIPEEITEFDRAWQQQVATSRYRKARELTEDYHLLDAHVRRVCALILGGEQQA